MMNDARYAELVERGRNLQAHNGLDPHRTALVVVDLQNGFMLPDSPFGMSAALKLVPRVNATAVQLRAAGGHVVWTRHSSSDEPGKALAQWHREQPVNQALSSTFQVGSAAHSLHPTLDVRPEDAVVDKFRYSAFAVNSSNLDAVLRERHVETIIVAGCAANCCCDGTSRDAYGLGYRVFYPEDANAAFTLDETRAAVVNLEMTCADTRPVNEVMALIGGGSAR